MAVYIDTEGKCDPDYLERCVVAQGGDTDLIRLVVPPTGEIAMDIVRDVIEHAGLVILDSLAGLVTSVELDSNVGDAKMAMQAKLITKGLKYMKPDLALSSTAFLATNQVRANIGGYGNPEMEPGGKARAHFATIRGRVSLVTPITKNKQRIGGSYRVRTRKNQLRPPWQDAEFDIIWGQGVDPMRDMCEMAMKTGVFERSGSSGHHRSPWWEGTINGKANILAWVKENTETHTAIKEAIT